MTSLGQTTTNKTSTLESLSHKHSDEEDDVGSISHSKMFHGDVMDPVKV